MTSTTRVLIGLGAGVGAGIALREIPAGENPTISKIVNAIEPIGTLWLNALRMTVVPLVLSLVITGVATAHNIAATGRLARRTIITILILLAAGAVFSAIVSPAAFALVPINKTAIAMSAGATIPTEVPPLAQWITGIIPTNPIKAASDGAMLPLVVFALFFGFAVTRIEPIRRARLLELFEAIAETMMVIVKWVLIAAPVGVFALVLPIAARGGLGIVGAVASYVIVDCAILLAGTIALYPLVMIFGGVSLRRFAKACAPAQAVAVSTQSSLASLPAMLAGASEVLKLPPRVTSLVLPLAVAIFRMTSPMGYIVGAAFVARLYGVHLSPLQYAAGVAVGVIISMGAVGLPGQVSFMGTHIPVFSAMGLPLDPIALLLAVDTIPDIFCTAGNVTADMTLATLVGMGCAEPASVLAGPDKNPRDNS